MPPKRPEFKSARTGGAKIVEPPSKSTQQKYTKIVVVLLLLLLLLGGIAGFLLWFLLPPEFDFCSIKGIPTEYEILNCERQKAEVWCEFDVSDCPSGCLLSYKQDPFGCFTSCECATEGLLESDVQFSAVNFKAMTASYITEEDSSFKSSSVSIYQTIWDWNVVNERVRIPYSIDPSLKGRQKSVDAINEAITLFSDLTCIDFVPYTEEKDFIEFIAELNGCRSFVGRISGRQWINLSKDCFHLGNIIHLMLHTLGFWHENSRPERDDYVTVNMENISPGNNFNFKPLGRTAVRDFNSTYDINSITHFGGLTFSMYQLPTIIDKAGTTLRSQRLNLTQQDIDNVNHLYICFLSPGFRENQKDDHWGEWGDWQLCSASCGDGQRARFRECLDKVNTIVYRSRCPGEKYEVEKCSSDVSCKKGTWGQWSPCTVTCSSGIRHRTSCCLPDVKYETEKCTKPECPDDINAGGGFWLAWKEWGSCSRSCGSGWRRRSRDCNSKFWKVFEVRNCPWQLPSGVDIERCQTKECDSSVPPPTWSSFGNWSTCTTTCGNSVKYKYRSCLPDGGECVGLNAKIGSCDMEKCPAHSNKNIPTWEFWSPWAACEHPCNKTTRTRSCFAADYHVVDGCFGKQSNSKIDEETRICSVEKCSPPVDLSQLAMTEWTQWGPYTACTKTCGRDLKQRVRKCMQGIVATTDCPGESIDRTTCGLEECSNWAPWGNWGACVATCGVTSKSKVRQCLKGGAPSTDCVGEGSEKAPCTLDECPIALWFWNEWGACSATCGDSTKTRTRRCLKEGLPSEECEGFSTKEDPEKRECSAVACPVALWSNWGEWPPCTVTCGTATITRNRKCVKDAAEVPVSSCTGLASDSKQCPIPGCQAKPPPKPSGPIRAAWGQWDNWNPLDCACAVKRRRIRKCEDLDSGEVYTWHKCGLGMSEKLVPCLPLACGASDEDEDLVGYVTFTSNGTNFLIPLEEYSTWNISARMVKLADREARLFSPDMVERWKLPPRPSCTEGWEGVVDVNSDGADDIICISNFNTIVTLINNKNGSFSTQSGVNFDFCQFGSGELLMGDFDGDQSQDILCFDRKNKVARVTWREGSTFAAISYDFVTGDFCSSATASLQVHHMNDDQRSDLLCVGADSRIAVLLNHFTG